MTANSKQVQQHTGVMEQKPFQKRGESEKPNHTTIRRNIKILFVGTVVSMFFASCGNGNDEPVIPEPPKPPVVDNTLRYNVKTVEVPLVEFTGYFDEIKLLSTRKEIEITNPKREIGQDTIAHITDSINRSYNLITEILAKESNTFVQVKTNNYKIQVNGSVYEPNIGSVQIWIPNPTAEENIDKYLKLGQDSLVRLILSQRNGEGDGHMFTTFPHINTIPISTYYTYTSENTFLSLGGQTYIPIDKFKNNGIKNSTRFSHPTQLFKNRFDGRTYLINDTVWTTKLVTKTPNQIEDWDNSVKYYDVGHSSAGWVGEDIDPSKEYSVVQVFKESELIYEGVLTKVSEENTFPLQDKHKVDIEFDAVRKIEGDLIYFDMESYYNTSIAFIRCIKGDPDIGRFETRLYITSNDLNGKGIQYFDDQIIWHTLK